MKLKLVRTHPKADYIIGDFYVDGALFSNSLERPWKNNETDISCIPIGIYNVQMLYSPHFNRDLPHLVDVPNRDHIMIHSCNFVHELLGCVGVGQNKIKGGLINSRDASDRLNIIITASSDPVTIEITNS